jgi:UDP-N-acetylglucosamine acyltransferase
VIHPTAVIHPEAQIPADAQIGPYVVIDAGVRLGAGCVLGPYVYLTGMAVIGLGNQFHAGCVIGDAPQDLKYKGQPTKLRIGDFNVFREHVTLHRSATDEGETVVGSHNYLMASAHVGHNSRIGNHVVIANGALLGGHVTIDDRAFISGTALIHQFTRVGTLVMMQGGAGASKDVPPYTIATGVNHICGLNVVGLRRAGITPTERLELKQLYHLLFRSGLRLAAAVEQARKKDQSPTLTAMLDFIAESKKGVCPDLGRKSKGTAQQELAEEQQ